MINDRRFILLYLCVMRVKDTNKQAQLQIYMCYATNYRK